MTSVIEKPYFMTNDDWFEFDLKAFMYVLTDKATEKAKQSYKDYYKLLEMVDNKLELEK